MKINWDAWLKVEQNLRTTLCRGEEKLTDAEVAEINEALAVMAENSAKVHSLVTAALDRFRSRKS